ncbi:hypothetical protein [Virgibacillus sp. LDC-1]|uniref:hypothetical protein n=1 Tax=Virgibacillus sp. LDC-1 TaxID=3039856 RepID=UPI0032E7F616
MMKRMYINLLMLLVMILFLSGCMYPKNELAKNKIPNEAQLETVQHAVEQYQKETGGLVPIKTKPNETPIFEKYLIDFSLLKEKNVLTELPGNAFENGGVYQYTLLYPDNSPKVKLIDLRITEAIRNVNVKLEAYRNKHLYPPFGQEITKGLYTIDYKKLGLDRAPHVRSPFSSENLPIIMDVDGELYVDYRIDLNQALQTYTHQYKEGDDIRFILPDNSPFVPAYSLPYTLKDGEPVFAPRK